MTNTTIYFWIVVLNPFHLQSFLALVKIMTNLYTGNRVCYLLITEGAIADSLFKMLLKYYYITVSYQYCLNLSFGNLTHYIE